MKKLLVANWKMNPITVLEARQLWLASRRAAKGARNVQLVICPPAVFLQILVSGERPANLWLGAQDAAAAASGAETGGI